MKNKFNPGYNNIYIGNMENEALNSLGEAKKAKNGSFKESNEKILFENKNSPLLKDRKESLSQNVYMNEKNESDIKEKKLMNVF